MPPDLHLRDRAPGCPVIQRSGGLVTEEMEADIVRMIEGVFECTGPI